VGFLDRRTIQEDNRDLEEQSSIAKETHCIHAVQLKLLKNLIPDNEETCKLNVLFLYLNYEICVCN